jgi:hypothetical protein
MDFSCQVCGKCCFQEHPFNLHEWEAKWLWKYAAERNLAIDLKPKFGAIKGKKYC